MTVKNLTVGYGEKHVLDRLELNLQKGQLTCLLGRNGAGKSTLMRSLAGIQKPLHGEVTLNQELIQNIPAKVLAKELSLVLTDRNAPGNLTVYALVALGRFPYTSWLGTLSQNDKDIIHGAMEATGILHFANTHVGQLSDGERQKVMIARALAQDTPLIFLDEPTAHLDLPNRIEIFHLLRSLAVKEGKAILLSSHEMDMALAHADQLWLINLQNSIDAGVPEDLVLQGKLARAFAQEGLTFDYAAGGFKRDHVSNQQTIRLVGKPILVRWTTSALERAGFDVNDTDQNGLTIEVSGTRQAPEWTVQSRNTTYKSIQELLANLNT